MLRARARVRTCACEGREPARVAVCQGQSLLSPCGCCVRFVVHSWPVTIRKHKAPPFSRSLQAVKLVIKVMSKTMDSTNLTPDKVELATLSIDDKDRLCYRVYAPADLQPVLDAVNADQAREKEAAQ